MEIGLILKAYEINEKYMKLNYRMNAYKNGGGNIVLINIW